MWTYTPVPERVSIAQIAMARPLVDDRPYFRVEAEACAPLRTSRRIQGRHESKHLRAIPFSRDPAP